MELDHVLIAVTDLEAADELVSRSGLVAVDGGRHSNWGTANRIVPLAETYLELVAVVDRDEAAGNAFGRWVAENAKAGPRPFGWAARTDGLDTVAHRLDVGVETGSRRGRDGVLIRWRLAGLEEAAAEPYLPFFIEWAPGTKHPGASEDPRLPQASITRLLLRGDPARLAWWLGPHSLPIRVEPGRPALTAVVLTRSGDEIVIGGEVVDG